MKAIPVIMIMLLLVSLVPIVSAQENPQSSINKGWWETVNDWIDSFLNKHVGQPFFSQDIFSNNKNKGGDVNNEEKKVQLIGYEYTKTNTDLSNEDLDKAKEFYNDKNKDNRLDLALIEVDNAVKLDEKNGDAWELKGDIYRDKTEYNIAIDYYNNAKNNANSDEDYQRIIVKQDDVANKLISEVQTKQTQSKNTQPIDYGKLICDSDIKDFSKQEAVICARFPMDIGNCIAWVNAERNELPRTQQSAQPKKSQPPNLYNR